MTGVMTVIMTTVRHNKTTTQTLRLHRDPSSADMYCVQRSNQAEDLKQPYDDNNDDNDIQDAFDLSIHGDVVINEPKQHANHN
jgi:hypothetical protein